ncbi:MAG: hypothetical protein JSS51_04760, partial [Planctomycetes bacterium]|nr:hypothetical protein [Planctomycetota bacterium]
MHRLVNVIATLTLVVGLMVVGGWQYRRLILHGRENELHQAAVRLKREVDRRAAMLETDKSPEGWPKTIDPAWFGDNPPRNLWIGGKRPWLEVASGEQS